jgi:hypothetical protein
MGIDDETDWYDYLHFNVYGAEKFSRWLGTELLTLPELEARPASDALWSERLAALEEAAANGGSPA